VGCSSTTTDKRHEYWAAAGPMAECLLGGTALRGAGGCEADSRGALVLVAGSTSVMVVLGQNALYILVGFVWLSLVDHGASFCSGLRVCQASHHPKRVVADRDEFCLRSKTAYSIMD